MKAILVREHGGPEVLKLEDLPDPKPGADQVVVRLKAVGVNPVDVYIRTGAYARKPALPFVPGSDAGGEIESVGANVKSCKPGDRVFIHGTAAEHTNGHYGGAYAQKAVCNLDHIYSLPANITFGVAAFFRMSMAAIALPPVASIGSSTMATSMSGLAGSLL